MRRSRTFLCSRLKKDSMAALSPTAPTLPIELAIPWRLRARTNFLELNRAISTSRCSTGLVQQA